MGGPPRDRAAERAAITAAASRLLAGTPLRTTSGKLTATELTAESGVRRDVLYEHRDLVDEFKAQARLRDHVPDAMQELADRCSTLGKDLAATREELHRERAAMALLRRVVTELSIELDQARAQASAGITRLDSRRPPARHRAIWRTILAMLDANPRVTRGGFGEYWLGSCHTDSMLIGIRRETGADNQSIGIRRSLNSLASTPRMATRSWYEQEVRLRIQGRDAWELAELDAAFNIFAALGQRFVDSAHVIWSWIKNQRRH